MRLCPRKGVLKREKFPNTRKHFLAESVASLGSTEGNTIGRKKIIIKTHRLRAQQ